MTRCVMGIANKTHLHVNFVSAQHNRNVLAHSLQITVPVRHVLVRNSRRDVEHDDPALALNVVTITETAELLLSSCVPDIKADRAEVGEESERVNLNSQSCCSKGEGLV